MTFLSLGDYPLMILTQEEAYTQFAAYEIATFTLRTVTHRPHHDIESFYWVLLWMVLRHSDHSEGQELYEHVFSATHGSKLKLSWVLTVEGEPGCPLVIADDEPLTELMQRLKDLVSEQVIRSRVPGTHAPVLTYDAVVKVFDAALAEDRQPSHALLDPVKTSAIWSLLAEQMGLSQHHYMSASDGSR